MSYKIPDYTENSGISDKLIAESSPVKNVPFTDNLKFSGQNETDAMPIMAGTFRSSPGSTRVEIDQQNNALYIYQDGEIRAALTGQGINFNTPAGVGSGAVYGQGTNQLAVDVGAGGALTLFTETAFTPDTNNIFNLGTDTERWSTIYLVNTPDVSSDLRLKDDLTEIPYGLDTVLQLKPYKFKMWGKERLGFIAQQVNPIIPEIVNNIDRPEVYASMRYEEVIPVLVKAIQELTVKVKTLEEKVV